MEEWKVIQLKEVCELIPGFAFKSSEFGEHEYSAIKIGDIQPPYVMRRVLQVSIFQGIPRKSLKSLRYIMAISS